MESHVNIFTQNSRHTLALIERNERNERIKSGNESAEVKFLDKHSASGDLKENMDTVCGSLASQPASQLATVALASSLFFLLWPSILFLLLSSLPSHPLSLMCVKEKNVAVVYVRIKDFTVLLLDCVRRYMRAHPFLT